MTKSKDGRPEGVLEEGRTIWRLEHAHRAAVLLDGADYFAALRSSLLQARHSILIAGWDIDSRLRLVGPEGVADDGRPEAFRELLEALVDDRPELEVRLLLWDYSILYSLEREPLTALKLNWTTPPRLVVELDDCLPLGGAHHQKFAVIDDAVAFCGGLDLTIRRWDTRAHRPGDERRTDPAGEPYPPFHDAQMVVEGDVATALGALIRERWRRCTDEPCLPDRRCPAPSGSPWPDEVRPDFEDIPVGIARTLAPVNDGDPSVEEVRALYVASIAAARRFVYIENQYFTSPEVGDALAERMHAVPGLEVVVVAPRRPGGWLEEKTMGAGQARLMARFDRDDLGARIRFCYPVVRDDDDQADVMVHAKVMVVDDRILRVGSSNLNRRSMGLDSECDLVLTASCEHERGEILTVLARLVSHHLGADLQTLRRDLEEGRSLIEIVDSRGCAERHLRKLQPAKEHVDAVAEALESVADPERPLDAEDFVGDMFGAEAAGDDSSSRGWHVALAAGLVLVLAAIWRFSPLSEWTDPESVAGALDALRAGGWSEILLLGAFVLGGLVLFPVTVLVTVTGMILGPWNGFAVAMVGALTSAALSFFAGARIGQKTLEGLLGGRRVRSVRRALGKHGVLTVAALRNVPVAPFTVVNVIMGALGLGFGVFMAGTVAGLLPGILVLTVLGDRFAELWRNPDAGNLALLVGVILAWIGLAAGLHRFILWLRRNR